MVNYTRHGSYHNRDEFQLYRASSRNGNYVKVTTRRVTGSLASGSIPGTALLHIPSGSAEKWFKAKGQSCQQNTSKCGSWGTFSNKVQVQAPPPPTGVPIPGPTSTSTPTPTPTSTPVGAPTPTPIGIPVTLPEFNVSVRYNKGNIEDDVSHWGVLHHDHVRIFIQAKTPLPLPLSYEFRLVVYPIITGFQIASASAVCNWTDPPPKAVEESKWFKVDLNGWSPKLRLVRCVVGNENNVGMSLQAKDISSGQVFTMSATNGKSIQPAWHRPGKTVTYWVAGTNSKGNAIHADKMFSEPKPPNLDPALTPNSVLTDVASYSDPVAPWNKLLKGYMEIKQASSESETEGITIRGYWDTDPSNGKDPKCGKSIACTWGTGGYPVIGNQ